MKNLDSKLALSRLLSHRFAIGRFLRGFLSLLFIASILGVAAAAASVSRWPAVSFGTYQSSSIADFDEDFRPDLASVRAGKSNGLNTDYWVDLQLSAAERQTFRIVAPMGSVQISSRDVNGDNIPDLVLTSTSLNQPVAILLNDGRGTFSRVDPAAFPEAFSESQASWSPITDQETDAFGAPRQAREDICSEIDLFLYVQSRSRFTPASNSRFGTNRFLISHSGRAPPFRTSSPLS